MDGLKHLWTACFFEDGGPPLWKCVNCGEMSYHDIPDAVGCKRGDKKEPGSDPGNPAVNPPPHP